MKTLLVILSLFILSGCEGMEWTVISDNGHHGYHPTGHISYTLGYYTGSHYNGYSVHGSHGHRYYYAPVNYVHHYYYPRPHYVRPVVVHQHVHVAACYVRGGHSYNPPRPRHNPTPRQRQHTFVPNRTPDRVAPRQRQPDRVAPRQQRQPDRVAPQRNNRVERNDSREDRTERKGNRQNRERQNKK